MFAKMYGMETIGLRYFNVFGQRHSPQSEYAAIIPKLVMQLMRHESPALNGDGEYSHDFNFIGNVVQANLLAVLTADAKAINQVYNITFEERTSLYQLAICLKEMLSAFDESIAGVNIMHEPVPVNTEDDVAITQKARELLGYQPHYSLRHGLLQSASWYWTYLPQLKLEIRN